MPGKDGFTLADEIAEDKRLADIPVVLVTAVAESPGQMMQAFEQEKGLTALNILPKSAAHKGLVDAVAAALAGKKQPSGSEEIT